MIRVDREAFGPPEFLLDEEYRQLHVQALTEVERHFAEGGGQFTKQSRVDIKYIFEPLFQPISEYLQKLFQGKCAYSERRIDHFREHNLHFHRPPQDALDENDEPSPDHYWWLILEWRNWYSATELVQSSKSHYFPVFGSRSDVGDAEHLDDGILLDPCLDDPLKFLSFNESGEVSPRAGLYGDELLRAEASIQNFGLNDSELVRARSFRILEQRESLLMPLVAAGSGKTKPLIPVKLPSYLIINPEEEFAGCLRQSMVRDVLELLPEMAENVQFQSDYQAEIEAVTADSRFKEEAELSLDITSDQTDDSGLELAGTERSRPFDESQDSSTVIRRHDSLRSIYIRNFKGIEQLELSLIGELSEDDIEEESELSSSSYSSRRWCVFLGENGCGKSSILQAIAWALAYTGSESSRAALGGNATLFEKRYLRRGETEAEIRLSFGTSSELKLSYNKEYPELLRGSLGADDQLRVFVRAYGETRLGGAEIEEGKGLEQIRIMNLLEPDAKLIEPEAWLTGLAPSSFNSAATTLLRLMPNVPGVSHPDDGAAPEIQPIRIEDGEVMVYDQPLSFVSDGYRAVITLACDMMAGLAEGFGDYASAPGIVIIDEVGAHLHPRWRMKIVSALKDCFPNLQFIVSTHEPLCLRGLRKGEVVKVERQLNDDDQYEMVVERIQRSPSKYRVDQLLTSEFFGLDSTIDPGIDGLFQQYYRLLAKTDPDDQEKQKRRELKRKLYRHNTLGYSRRDRMIYELIDQHLADNPLKSSIEDLKPETKREILDILQGGSYFEDQVEDDQD